MSPSQFGFGDSFVQQVTSDTPKELSRLPAFPHCVLPRKADFRVIIGSQPFVETLSQMFGPFLFDFAGTNQVQTEHSADGRMGFGGNVVNLQGSFGRVQDRVVRSRHASA